VVPLLHDGRAIGAIAVGRPQAGPFSRDEIALLQTFAAQAVIAIENVRLFNETKETLEQQTATSEILRVIASSPTDLQPVFAAIAERTTWLCDARDAVIWRPEGDRLRVVAAVRPLAGAVASSLRTLPLSRGSMAGRAFLERAPVHVPDLASVVETDFPDSAFAFGAVNAPD
jgi:hypothetical protein